jgi:hypothetical protein
MTKSEANQLLNKLKDGAKLSYHDTTRALAITGDYEEHGSEGVDTEIQEETIRPWDNECFRLVATDLVRHRSKAWVSRR